MDLIARLSWVRVALNTLEAAVMLTKPDQEGKRTVTSEIAQEAMQRKALLYDKGGEEHYNVISAFIKSMRGSDPDAALYWLARMLDAGEDPLLCAPYDHICIGGILAMQTRQPSISRGSQGCISFCGNARGWIPLAQGVSYLACAPKSNASTWLIWKH